MKRAWVVGAYGNNGGNHMNYHIARICKEIFSLETYSVGLDSSIYHENNIFNHQREFTEITLKDFLAEYSESDILISNPSFSDYLLGYKVRCKKIMYVQHYNTYRRLDLKFDHYVSVSAFVKQYLSAVYNLDSNVISAFTESPIDVTAFDEKRNALLVYSKNRQARLNYFNTSQKKLLAIEEIDYLKGGTNRDEYLKTIDRYKYLLTLSIDEGFGLVSLEAMRRGLIVFGFDGYGGRDYMIRGYNCMISRYPDWESVIKSINQTIAKQRKCNSISKNALNTAIHFNRKIFEKAWIKVLKQYI